VGPRKIHSMVCATDNTGLNSVLIYVDNSPMFVVLVLLGFFLMSTKPKFVLSWKCTFVTGS